MVNAAVRLGLERIENLAPQTRRELFARIANVGPRFLTIAAFDGDVRRDADFQRTFNWFYQVRRDLAWRSHFYDLFHELRSDPAEVSFERIYTHIHSYSNRQEYSFTTKLLHTLDTAKPIVDAKVMRFLGIRLKGKKNSQRCGEHYAMLCEIIKSLLSAHATVSLLREFDCQIPRLARIAPVKKLDFVMWKWDFVRH